jgi:hypothetical protein
MTDRADGGQVILVWIAKCGAVVIPASIVTRVWSAHPHVAFGLGLSAGIVLQHFIPPKGKPLHLCTELFVAVVAAVLLGLLK